ncbi:MAG: SEC-C metal-binding domain-containing protein, partial [Prevotella sp.]|nr:SEC-C metal-binding domain-containing protein [Prevotella sp.]
KILGMECPFSKMDLVEKDRSQLEEDSFQQAMDSFNRKVERIRTQAWPIVKQVYEAPGNMYERIAVPFTDGKQVYTLPCDLKEAYETECKSVAKVFEKAIILHIIDDCWKENLRQLDELKHSVQNASYEQKDPLVIFKLESVKCFDDMVNDMYDRTVSILMRMQLNIQGEVQEAAPEVRQRQNYTESKAELNNDPNQAAAAHSDTRAQQPRTPIVKEKMPGRNDPCPCGSGKKFKNCHGRGLV